MPVPADGLTLFLGLWGGASLAVAALFAWVMRGADHPTPLRRLAEERACECISCICLRHSA
jgi:hypothetical protein